MELFGIHITEEYLPHLNCIIAPKTVRTVKFLNALSFHPLQYILLPDFITKVLESIHQGVHPVSRTNYDDFKMKEVEDLILEKTKLPTKLFQRAFISNINIASDIIGGVDTISSVLKNHGIQDIRKLGEEAFLPNNHPHKKISLSNGKEIHPPKCIIISGPKSSPRKWKKQWGDMNAGNTDGLLIVNWNWCVDAIFQLDVDYNDKKNVVFSSL